MYSLSYNHTANKKKIKKLENNNSGNKEKLHSSYLP